MKNAKMRIVQLDLARQKETLAEVFRFFKLAHDYKYDAVFVYLEDRIKTKSYPYVKDEESYSEDEIKQMVNYAAELGLELIPVVSNFAHAERFLEHPELLHLAELRDGAEGFYSAGIYITACPLLKESQEFFDAYISEVAALFPSKYFNVGLDEDFDIGSCKLCKADVEEHGGIGHLFLNHVIRTNKLINSLGKEMMMFDDMIWYCPEILPSIPKNVIMISWSYYYIERFPRVSMGNNRQIDVFKEFEKYGIRYALMIWSCCTNNGDTYTKYANKYSPMAYICSTWQMSPEPLHYVYPHVAYTGKLRNGELVDDSQARMMKCVAELCGATDPRDIAILAESASKPYWVRTSTFLLHDVITRRNDNFDDEYKHVRYNYELLKNLSVSNDLTQQLIYRAEREKLYYEEFMLAQDIMDMRTGMHKIDLKETTEKLEAIKTAFERQYKSQYEVWHKVRKGIPATSLDEEKAKVMSDIDKLIESAKNAVFGEKGVLDMTLLLPDKSIYNKIEVVVKYTDGGEQNLPAGMYKPLGTPNYNIMDKGPYLYTVSFVIDGHREIEGCRVNVSGYGNVCITYVTAYSDGVYYVPSESMVICGRVENEEHLLVNDTRWCSLGNYDMMKEMLDRSKTKEVSSVDINMLN